MTASDGSHLWLALSPHGYGHAVMTAPVVAELRRRRPNLRLTIQTGLGREFLATRYGDDFHHVPEIPDFGFCMASATQVDREASLGGYLSLHADWPKVVEAEAERIAAARPDAVLANVPYVTVAAAARAGVPVVAMSSLNWADMAAAMLAGLDGVDGIVAQMREAYVGAKAFLRCTPAMEMTLPNLINIGPVARRGADRGAELRMRLQAAVGTRIGLIAFGGIDHDLALSRFPRLPGWVWLSTLPVPDRADLRRWEDGGIPFTDLISSVDLVIGKVGYGTFTEAGLAGTPMIFVERPDWPESPNLDRWLDAHTRCQGIDAKRLFDPDLGALIDAVLARPIRPPALPTGIAEAADVVERALDGWRLTP